jgi:hypothetical protein
MRLLVTFLLLTLISFQQEANPASSTQTGLKKHGTQRPATEARDKISDKPDAKEVASNCADVNKPAPNPENGDPYDASKDTLYRRYLWATIIGVAGAVLGIFVLARQTIVQMDAQRGWVIANQISNPPNPLFNPETPFYTPGVVFIVEFIGNSPVKVLSEKFRCRIVPAKAATTPPEPDLEKIPVYGKPMFEGSSVYPPGGQKIALNIPLESGPLDVKQFEDLKFSRAFLCAYGRIDYLDAFKRKRMTQVCVIYNFAWGGVATSPDGTVLNPPGFRMGGPEGYNEVT